MSLRIRQYNQLYIHTYIHCRILKDIDNSGNRDHSVECETPPPVKSEPMQMPDRLVICVNSVHMTLIAVV